MVTAPGRLKLYFHVYLLLKSTRKNKINIIDQAHSKLYNQLELEKFPIVPKCSLGIAVLEKAW